MTIFSELFDDAKFIIGYRRKAMKQQKVLNAKAPKAGDLAPDFTLSDISGTKSVTLSELGQHKSDPFMV